MLDICRSKDDNENLKLILEFYIYTIRRRSESDITWRCEKKYCGGTIRTPLNYREMNMNEVVYYQNHSHDPSIKELQKALMNRNRMKIKPREIEIESQKTSFDDFEQEFLSINVFEI